MSVNKNKEYYKALKKEDICKCDYCKNYISQVKKQYPITSDFLKDSLEHQNKQVDYILINPENEDLWVMCSDGVDTAIEFHYRDGIMKNNYVPMLICALTF